MCINQSEDNEEKETITNRTNAYNKKKKDFVFFEEDGVEIRLRDLTEEWSAYTFEPVAKYLEQKHK